MKALCWSKEKKLELIDIEEPKLEAADQVKLRTLKVGICGTDREEVGNDMGIPPDGETRLILGHEMIGEVVEVGKLVTKAKPGDLAIFTVRRGCGECPACSRDAYDMCYTGNYTERGIKGRHGFQTEYVVDHEKFLIPVPQALRNCGVLCEPTSVVEKAIDMVERIQSSRLPNWADDTYPFKGRTVLVAGLGPIGLLGAMILILRGAKVYGYARKDSKALAPSLLKKMGGTYISAKDVSPKQLGEKIGHIDVILEAAGNANLDFDLLAALGTNGAYVLTGVTPKDRPITLDGGATMLDIVLKNQVIIGSVNAHIRHWVQAIKDLEEAENKWDHFPALLLTSKFAPQDFKKPFFEREENEIKSVIEWRKEGV